MPAPSDRVKLAQRHERLRDLMAAKVLKLVGRKVTDGERQFINHELDMMINRGDAAESSLAHVAAHVRAMTPSAQEKHAQKHRRTDDSRSQVSSVAAAARKADSEVARVPPKPASLTPHDVVAASEEPSQHRIPRPADVHADDLWAKIADKQAEEFHREIIVQRRHTKQREAEQRDFLDSQVAIRKRREAEAKIDSRKFVVEEERQRQQWAEEEKKIEAMKKQRFAEEKKSRDAQLEEARKRRAVEEAKRKIEDEEAAKKVVEQYHKEQEALKQRRVRAREEVVKAQEFNQQFKSMKQREKEKERDIDLKHQRMYLDRLAKEEADREAALVKMQEKQRHQQQIAFQLQETNAEKAVEDERKAQDYLAKREAAYEDEQRKKREKAESEKIKQKQYLMLQMVQREEERKAQREAVLAERRAVQLQVEAEERKEQEKRLATKQKQQAHRDDIAHQIEVSQSRHRTVFMTDQEKLLNQPLLRTAGLSP